MEIYNTTTGETITLIYADRRRNSYNQINCAVDLTADDPSIVYNQEEDRYKASQDSIDYWTRWFGKTEEGDDLEREVREISRESGEDDIDDRIRESVDNNYSDHEQWPAQRIELLNKLKAEIEDECE